MIGYQTENKNVSFFSKVADRSVGKGLPYQFVWIGGYAGETKKLYRSKNVLWVGDQDQVMDTLNSIDILLFTSCSDTFGLALAEALVKGKRIVSYVENGLAPFLEKLKGCRIYKCFDEEVVLACIEEVCQEKVDVHRHQELAMELCSMQNFEQRLNDLFEY
jgi:glycosyltransferase involved in cell wall biosynthesis